MVKNWKTLENTRKHENSITFRSHSHPAPTEGNTVWPDPPPSRPPPLFCIEFDTEKEEEDLFEEVWRGEPV